MTTNSDISQTARLLQSVDWSFADYSPNSDRFNLHSLHWYPAPFVPPIPSILTKSLSCQGDVVLDPFCGTGVTGIEAAKLNRRFVQFDVNPTAVAIADAKLIAARTLTTREGEKLASELEELARNRGRRGGSSIDDLPPEAAKWFHPRTLAQLALIRGYVERIPTADLRAVMRVAFSAILHRASSQPKHYSYIVDNCYPEKKLERDAFALMLDHLAIMVQAAENFRKHCRENHVIPELATMGITAVADARDLSRLPDGSVDLVVTSPPYLNVNDYVKSQRLTHLFYQPFPLKADEADIGARRKRGRKSAYADYLSQIGECIDQMARVTKSGGHVCLVIGQSSSQKTRDAVDRVVALAIKEMGGDPILDVNRPIAFRKIQNAGIGHERILVFPRGAQ